MVILDSLKDEDKDLQSLRILDSKHDLRLPGSVDIHAPRGTLEVLEGEGFNVCVGACVRAYVCVGF